MADQSNKCIRVWVTLAALLPVLAGLAIWFGLYNVAADVPHWPVTEQLLETLRDRSMTVHAQDIAIPKDLGRRERISAGAGLYDEMCTNCHLTPSIDSTEMRQGLYPKPPAFPVEGEDDPAVAFWTIKHGVKSTAMPAWGPSHTDDQIWDMVAFLVKLKGMSAADYKALVAAAPPDDDDEHGHGHGMHGH